MPPKVIRASSSLMATAKAFVPPAFAIALTCRQQFQHRCEITARHGHGGDRWPIECHKVKLEAALRRWPPLRHHPPNEQNTTNRYSHLSSNTADRWALLPQIGKEKRCRAAETREVQRPVARARYMIENDDRRMVDCRVSKRQCMPFLRSRALHVLAPRMHATDCVDPQFLPRRSFAMPLV